jgi:threonine/homoserine efflux transporter RhtA
VFFSIWAAYILKGFFIGRDIKSADRWTNVGYLIADFITMPLIIFCSVKFVFWLLGDN